MFNTNLEFNPDAQFDFHQFDSITLEEIEFHLEKFLKVAAAEGHTKVLIITGKGRIVKPTVQKLLRKNKLVKHFGQAGYFSGQGGAFEVWLNKTSNIGSGGSAI